MCIVAGLLLGVWMILLFAAVRTQCRWVSEIVQDRQHFLMEIGVPDGNPERVRAACRDQPAMQVWGSRITYDWQRLKKAMNAHWSMQAPTTRLFFNSGAWLLTWGPPEQIHGERAFIPGIILIVVLMGGGGILLLTAHSAR